MHKQRRPPILSLGLCAGFLSLGLLLWFFSIEKRRTIDYFIEVTTQNLYENLQISNSELDSIHNFDSFERTFSFPTFLYQNSQILAWSDFRIVPSYQSIAGNQKLRYTELSQGKFLRVRRQISDNMEAVQLIELYSTPSFSNQYINAKFNQNIFPAATLSIDETDAEETNIQMPDGEALFGVKFDLQASIVQEEVQAFIAAMMFMALFFAFVYLNSWSWYLAESGKVWLGIVILVVGLVSGRVLMLYTTFPFDIYAIDLFNPRFYASSIYNPSLGDLLINMMFALSFTTFLFRYIFRTNLGEAFNQNNRLGNAFFLVIINLLGLFVLSFHYGLLENILFNSQIELDINKSLQFTSFRVVSILIFFTSSVIWFQTTHFVYSVSTQVSHGLRTWVINYIIACLIFALIGWILSLEVGFILTAQTIYLTLAYRFKLPDYLSQLSYSTLFYFFAASLLSSLVGTIAIYEYHEYEELIEKQRFANDLLIENDLKGEYLIHESIPKIQNDIFIQSRLLSPQISKGQIEQKIKRDYLGSYFDKYDVKVRLFDREGHSFIPDELDSTLNEVRQNYEHNEQYKTDYLDLYFIGDIDVDKPKRYLRVIPISRYDNPIGFIVLDLRLKKVIPQTVYPELLVDSRFIDNHRSFDYAFYSQNILNYKAGAFNYENLFEPDYFQLPRLFTKGIEKNGFHHYAIRSSDNRTLVITSSVYPTSFIISNFSFIFLSIVLGVLILLLFRSIDRTQAIRLNFGSKIQLYLNLAFFVPLVITSVVIINTLNSSYQDEIDRSSIKKVNALKDHIVNFVDDYLRNKINREALSTELNEIARYSQSDLSLFDINGKLITSSQPLIFANNLLSNRINPKALKLIIDEDREDVVLNESVGDLAYKSTYAAIKSFDSGELLGIIGIPFFGSKNHLERQTIETFTSILNIFTIVLIASLFISNLASRLLTHPLNLLTQKIRKTSLSKHNEPLQWRGEDEIGMVVDEYNKMLVNLEASKEALAKSQKESAWREIAKQVAHEIKNPLTPMKLSLQHLKRVIADKQGNEGEQFQKPIDNLLHQVDSLSDIATSFSAFAKMPIPENEKFELCGEVRRIAELFDNENVDLNVNINAEELFINGDQKLMGRIISNLIINGMQSVVGNEVPKIEVNLESNNKKVTIEVKDNGAGIPEEIQNKVFVPNFSTKDSGSGIGLAVAKRGIEHAGGNIWFETEKGKGTTFFVILPLAP